MIAACPPGTVSAGSGFSMYCADASGTGGFGPGGGSVDWSATRPYAELLPELDGGGGGIFDRGGSATDPRTTGPTAWQYLTPNWSHCLDIFTSAQGGLSASSLQTLLTSSPASGGVIWATDLTQTVDYYAHNGDTRVVGSFITNGATAGVIPGTHVIAVGADYYTDLTQTEQIAVAIHEVLHMVIPGGDPALARWIQGFGGDVSDYYLHGNSRVFTDWIVGAANHMDVNGGCRNP
jgi:hypothetical protein